MPENVRRLSLILYTSLDPSIVRERRGARIIAVEPVGVGRTAHPGVLDRDALHIRNAGDAGRLVAAERVGRRVEEGEATGEDRRVLDRHGAARRHEWPHRMTRIAEQRDAASAPAIVALAVKDRPQRHALDRLEHALEVGMKAGE